ncbi:hypothetical protein [Dactylosporangium sp. NPDC051541]|uniref:hypothetical protein n=1 Tax=Dactylosporangium sp. NPDC051541 TaxID=3363977 RepID=UPI003792ABCB
MGVAVRLGVAFSTDRVSAMIGWSDGTAMVLPLDDVPLVDTDSAGEDWAADALARVIEDADAAAGALVGAVNVVVPPGWSLRRREQVRTAAGLVGLQSVQVVPAPVAVCWHVLAGGVDLAPGARVLICDAGPGGSASVVRRDRDGGFTTMSSVDAATVTAGTPDDGTSLWVVAEMARRAMAGADLPAGAPDLVCVLGPGAERLELGRALQAATGVQPMLVVEAELAAVLGAVQGPGPAGEAPPPPLEGWRDIVATALPGVFSVLLFWQFMTGSERYGPREKVYAPGMLLASWGGLAVASVFALLAVAGGALLWTALRHDPSGAPEGGGVAAPARHRLTALAIVGGAGGGMIAAAVYALIAAGYFDLDMWPLLRWSVLPILPAALGASVVAVAVWRRPEPPHGSWPVWLRFPPSAVALAGTGMLLIAFDETHSPSQLMPLMQLVHLWIPAHETTIIGPVGRIGGLCIGAAVAWLLSASVWRRLLFGAALAALVAAVLSWRSSGAVAVGFCLVVAAWWAMRAAQLILRPLLFTPPPPAAAQPTGRPQ